MLTQNRLKLFSGINWGWWHPKGGMTLGLPSSIRMGTKNIRRCHPEPRNWNNIVRFICIFYCLWNVLIMKFKHIKCNLCFSSTTIQFVVLLGFRWSLCNQSITILILIHLEWYTCVYSRQWGRDLLFPSIIEHDENFLENVCYSIPYCLKAERQVKTIFVLSLTKSKFSIEFDMFFKCIPQSMIRGADLAPSPIRNFTNDVYQKSLY